MVDKLSPLDTKFSGTLGLFNARNYAKQLSPPWLQGFWGGRFIAATTTPDDLILEAAVLSLKSAMAHRPEVPADALEPLIEDRNLIAYPVTASINTQGYIDYIVDTQNYITSAWDRWEFAGTSGSIEEEMGRSGLVADVGYNLRYVVGTALSVSRSLEVVSFEIPSNTDQWSRFVVHINSGSAFAPLRIDTDTIILDDYQTVLDVSASAQTMGLLKSAVRHFKSGHETAEIIIQFTSDADMFWDDLENMLQEFAADATGEFPKAIAIPLTHGLNRITGR